MRARPVWLLLVAALLVVVEAGCRVGGPPPPAAVAFAKVELRGGAVPVTLSAAGDALLIGVRRDGQPVVPGLLRRGPGGAIDDLPAQAISPYAQLAVWRSIATDGQRIVAIGGERGGAHGHVRWSVWTGSAAGAAGAAGAEAGIGEQVQGFSTFGGYEAGDLVDAVLTPAGPALVGGWASARVGFDIAVWTTDGQVWTRQSSAGTALESGPAALMFPMAATALGQGILVAGWQLALDAGGRQQPTVWRSASGITGWTASALPEAGQAGAAVAARCWDSGCGVAGRVDGTLALWRLTGDAWTRLAGMPRIAVGDQDRLVAPIEHDGRLIQVALDGNEVKILRADNGDSANAVNWTVRTATGPTGTVTAVTAVGDTIYLLAGPDEHTQTLWRADLAALTS
ncbi:MAG TPA: hypothetical protein VGJ95_17305 [Pseudonocardiaceae bacterium]